MPFTVTEPHPTVGVNAYTHSGRGGAGNMFRAPVTTPASGVPTLTKVPSASSTCSHNATRFYAGRGGAGNAHPVSERRSLSLDDEYRYAAAVAKTVTTGHVGRGGAGNFFSSKGSSSNTQQQPTADTPRSSLNIFKSHRKSSDASTSSNESSEDGQGVRSGFWARLR